LKIESRISNGLEANDIEEEELKLQRVQILIDKFKFGTKELRKLLWAF
jgi:hypothetical protein